MAHAPQFLKLVQDAKQRVKETNVPDVKRRIDTGEKLILVDVREDNEWAKGISPAPCTWARASSSAISSSRFPIRGPNLCFIAVVVSAPLSSPTICKKWVTPTWNRWTAA